MENVKWYTLNMVSSVESAECDYSRVCSAGTVNACRSRKREVNTNTHTHTDTPRHTHIHLHTRPFPATLQRLTPLKRRAEDDITDTKLCRRF